MNEADDRFSSIAGGGLKKRRPTISVVPDPSETTEPSSGPTSEGPKKLARSETTRKTSAGEKARPKSAEVGGTRRAAFRVPEDVDVKLREKVRADGSSKVHVILDAIEHVVASEKKLDFSNLQPKPTRSALFNRPRTTTRATPTVQTEVTLDAASLGTIDKLADKYGSPTRTAFVLACLGEYLP